MVPSLRWNKLSSNWPIHVLAPIAHPLESLAASLTQDTDSLLATTMLMDDLSRDSRSLGLYVKGLQMANVFSKSLLVIDQFEELFTLCRNENERRLFIENLLTAAEDEDGPAVVIIALRADFYANCSSYSQLREALARHQEYIGAMSDGELRRAIEEPAHRGRWELEPHADHERLWENEVAFSRELITASAYNLLDNGDAELSSLLALYSLKLHYSEDDENALRQALMAMRKSRML